MVVGCQLSVFSCFCMKISHSPTRRGGFSLVEMLVAITLASAVLASVGLTLHMLWRLQTSRRNETAATETLSRLSVQFRDDAHQATRVESIEPKADGQAGMAFVLSDDRRVVYQPDGSQVRRTVYEADEATHRDSFRLGSAMHVTVQASSAASQKNAALAIAKGDDRTADSTRRAWMRITAAVDLRASEETE